VGPGSVVGYRVQEVLLGQQSTAVGRTTKVSGSFVVAGTVVRSGSATADMASVTSDQSERNAQFDGRIMEVGTYPTATLVLTRPIVLDPSFAEGSVHQYPASADLTLHGVTKPVTFTVSTERRGGTVYALTDIPIVFADWGIDNPSIGGFVTTQSTGTLEVLLALTMGTGNAPVTRASSGAAPPSGGGGPITVPSTTVPPLKVPSS
jgi:polyisoprenoid-binding protein YceI